MLVDVEVGGRSIISKCTLIVLENILSYIQKDFSSTQSAFAYMMPHPNGNTEGRKKEHWRKIRIDHKG